MKSINQIVSEYNSVLKYRRDLIGLFSTIVPEENFNIVVGGSYALKCQIPAFYNRKISDYDFIVKGDSDTIGKIKTLLTKLRSLYALPTSGSSSEAIPVGALNGKKCECLFKITDNISYRTEGRLFEPIENILKVKKEYCEKRIKQNVQPRQKDVEDIKLIEAFLTPLPF